MNDHHIRLNTSSKHKKTKTNIMNVYHILNTSSKYKKTKSIYYEQPQHQTEDII